MFECCVHVNNPTALFIRRIHTHTLEDTGPISHRSNTNKMPSQKAYTYECLISHVRAPVKNDRTWISVDYALMLRITREEIQNTFIHLTDSSCGPAYMSWIHTKTFNKLSERLLEVRQYKFHTHCSLSFFLFFFGGARQKNTLTWTYVNMHTNTHTNHCKVA